MPATMEGSALMQLSTSIASPETNSPALAGTRTDPDGMSWPGLAGMPAPGDPTQVIRGRPLAFGELFPDLAPAADVGNTAPGATAGKAEPASPPVAAANLPVVPVLPGLRSARQADFIPAGRPSEAGFEVSLPASPVPAQVPAARPAEAPALAGYDFVGAFAPAREIETRREDLEPVSAPAVPFWMDPAPPAILVPVASAGPEPAAVVDGASVDMTDEAFLSRVAWRPAAVLVRVAPGRPAAPSEAIPPAVPAGLEREVSSPAHPSAPVSAAAASSASPVPSPVVPAPPSADIAAAVAAPGRPLLSVPGRAPALSLPSEIRVRDKIAAPSPEFNDPGNGRSSGAWKTFLSQAGERVTAGGAGLGITGAKPAPTMFDPGYDDPVRSATSPAPAVMPAAVLDSAIETPSLDPVLAEGVRAPAHRAVEAALAAAGRLAGGDRQAMNLHFSVGGAELEVRVELRAGEVHTTFSTDSAGLRSVLAHEWQAMQVESAERPFRLAAPIFAPGFGGDPGLAAFADGRSTQHEQADARRPFGEVAPDPRRLAAAPPPVAGTAVAAPAFLPTSLHLHALA